jgi:uncharacterized membrane protein
LWIQLAGDSEFAVRFLSLFFGVLTVPLLYALARRLFAPIPGSQGSGQGVGLIAALIAMVAPLYVWYSQEARMYTLITFLLLLSSYALASLLTPIPPPPSPSLGAELRTRRGGRGWRDGGEVWLLFTLANVAAIYTHYFA